MIRLLPAVSLFIAGLSLVAASAAPRAARVATRVVLTENGARSNAVSGDETAAFCARFRLTAAEVADYFRRAAPVDEAAFHHDLDMSRCHAGGTIAFRGGATGRWFIDYERRGSLILANGATRYFYCLSCTSRRFDRLDAETAETAKALIRAARVAPR